MYFITTLIAIGNIAYMTSGAPLSTEMNGTTNVTMNSDMNPCPKIVSREEWGARPVTTYAPMAVTPVPFVVAHHGGIPHYCYDETTCSQIVRGYQDLHMDTQGWIDLGYHFVIGCDGNVYEGRGWDHVGAHAPGYNSNGIGISIIGDYTDHLPNRDALNAFEKLIECGVSLGKIRPDYKLIGHRQTRVTACPGDKFFQYLKNSSHYDPVPRPSANPLSANSHAKSKLAHPTIDITGSSLWVDLIALGVPRRDDTASTSVSVDKIEENIVNTENTDANVSH